VLKLFENSFLLDQLLEKISEIAELYGWEFSCERVCTKFHESIAKKEKLILRLW